MQGVIGGPSVTFNPYPYAQNNPVNMVDPNGEFPWLLAGLFLAGGGIDLGFQMGIEGRSFDEVNWLRVGVAGGTTAIGGVFGKALHSASIGGRTAFAAGAIADFGVGVAADRYLLGDGWGTAVASNVIGFGVGEIAGYAGKGAARLGSGLLNPVRWFADDLGLIPSPASGSIFNDLNGGRILHMSDSGSPKQPYLGGLEPDSSQMFTVRSHNRWLSIRKNNIEIYENWQGHHGVPSVWMLANYKRYSPGSAPVIAMPQNPNHILTFRPQRRFESSYRRKMGWEYPNFDWTQISETDIRKLANEMLDRANVPNDIRGEYWRLFDDYVSRITQEGS